MNGFASIEGMSRVSADIFNAELEGAYPFLSELVDMRRRARRHISAVSAAGAQGDQAQASPGQSAILQLLNEALVTELACVERYRNHARLESVVEPIKGEFLKYAQEEQGHAERLAQRIVQLGGQPRVSVECSRSSVPGDDQLDADAIVDMLEEDLIAERIAIDCYREIVQFIGKSDSRTLELLEDILAVEIGHARELAAIRAEMLRRDRLAGSTSTTLPQLDLQCA